MPEEIPSSDPREGEPKPGPCAVAEEAPSPLAPAPDAAVGEEGKGAGEPPAPAPAVGGDGTSFSQLLAGAMASPATANPAQAPPILAVPVVAVPCFLAPAALIDPPGFAGQFAMSHQAVLASVTAQAQMKLQSPRLSASSELLPSSFPHLMLPSASPCVVSAEENTCATLMAEKPPPSEQKLQSPRVVSTAVGDGFSWRKYGQKQVKSSENSRSYYRCTNSSCFAKKKVEQCPDGRIVEVIYRGAHNHEPPQKTRYSKERVAQSVGGPSGENETLQLPSSESNESHTSTCKSEQNVGDKTREQQLYCSSDCEGDPDNKAEEDSSEGPHPKRRITECVTPSSAAPVFRTIKEQKIVVQIPPNGGNVSDGYRWRKYGQKIVKGNSNPRSYYRCTHDGCPVRKHVEKAPDDAKAVVISYEGNHNHDQTSKDGSNLKGILLPLATSAVAAPGEQPNTSSSVSDHKPPKELLTNVDGGSVSDKALELGGQKALESAQTLLSMSFKSPSGDGAENTSSNGVDRSPFKENPAAVPVQNT